eukprot:CAMPEP_0204843782 /NCGR_PEP_ID=MMETSP1346-20131115/48183_1 /ASSEMBLY_ACC=CAM_ASM_000771 /TAXON_ID=215587 /ORGANISM="Aplanochytrium stocchinoi, Strain GSBS06" /LENGTH=463 /DNA_ID=CAMNT_0051982989 /DNA_START=271 /DNA_END=1662 /DNA_ORIENTATION=-
MVINRAYLESCPRRELQDLAKQFSVRANQKSSIIVDLILFEVHKEKQNKLQLEPQSQSQQDENDKIAANQLPEAEEKELSNRLKKLTFAYTSTSSASTPNQESPEHENVKKRPENRTNRDSTTLLSHTPIKYHPKQQSKFEKINGEEEGEVKISYAVNAIRALNCKNGVSYEQIQSFISNNPTIHLDSKDLNDVLCAGVDKGSILAVSGIDGDVRFFTPKLHPQTYTTSKISAFVNSTKSVERKEKADDCSQRFKVQTNREYLSKVDSRDTCKVNVTKNALQRAMAMERRNRQTARKTFINTWSSHVQKCNDKMSSIQMLNECICAQCGCNKSFVSMQWLNEKDTNVKSEKVSHENVSRSFSHSNNSTSSLIQKKGGTKVTPTASTRRVSLQLLYNSSEKPLKEKETGNKHMIPATPLVKKNVSTSMKSFIKPSPPWQIMESKSKPGKFYYYNPVTKESKWTY